MYGSGTIFEILHRKLKESIQIETFKRDTLKTLNLYDNVNGFNNAAGLLADKNHFQGFEDYCRYEVIQGVDRKKMEKIPEAAFREAVANALIHRVWDIDSHVRVSMFDYTR